MDKLRKGLTELLGTFILVLFGTGSYVIAKEYIGFFGVALVFGFTILFLILTFAKISGGHFNPAVSFTQLLSRQITPLEFIYYVVSQCAGAILASTTLFAIVSQRNVFLNNDSLKVVDTLGLGQNGYGKEFLDSYSYLGAFSIELILTTVLCLVILNLNKEKAIERKAFAIGLTVLVAHLISMPITGTSINPARSLGPALLVGGDALKNLPVFIIAPMLGAIVAYLIWYIIFDEKNKKVVEKETIAVEELLADIDV